MIKIVSKGGITEIYQDGNPIRHVKEVCFRHNATNGKPELTLVISDDKVEIDAHIVPELPEFYKPFYKKRDGLSEESPEINA